MTIERTLEQLKRLVGSWALGATHPAFPGLVVRGTAEVTWLEGERFLIHRARTEHPDFPDSISIIGFMESDRVGSEAPGESRLCMHYFDSRGVFRVYEVSIDDAVWRLWREAPGFSQRFSGTFSADGDTIDGRWQLRADDVKWENDLEITYRRSRP
jgi:hypothetical protein